MKKLISTMLAVIILCSALCVQTFALYIPSNDIPYVTEIKFTGKMAKSPISKAELYDWFYEFAEDDKAFEDSFYVPDGDELTFNLSFSAIPYKYAITLSNGEQCELYASDMNCKVGDYTVSVDAFVRYPEIQEAVNNNGKTLNVFFICNVYDTKSLESSNLFVKKGKETQFVVEKRLVDKFIKSVKFTNLPTKLYKDVDRISMKDVSVTMTFYNGKKKTAKVVQKNTNHGPMYTADDIFVYSYLDGKNLVCDFADAQYTQKVKVMKNPYKSIKITDYVCGESSLESIKYKLTKTDGTSKVYTYKFDKSSQNNALEFTYQYIATHNGYDVYFSQFKVDAQDSADGKAKIAMAIMCSDFSDTKEIDDPNPNTSSNSNLIAYFLQILTYVKTLISSIISK